MRTAEKARAADATVVFEPMNQISRARNKGASAATGWTGSEGKILGYTLANDVSVPVPVQRSRTRIMDGVIDALAMVGVASAFAVPSPR